MGVITFNGISSKELGIEVETFPTYEFPEREYEAVSVPGRNGDLYIDKGSYKNVTGKYDLVIGSHEITQPYLAERLVSWLTSSKGYCRLEDSYYPEIYRMALYKKPGSISNIINYGGKLSAEFECKPQKFLKSGEQKTTFSQSGTIINPTYQVSKPLLKVTGRGNGAININNKIVNINMLESYTSSGSGITNIEVDTDKFIEEIGPSTDNNFIFECVDLDVVTSVEAAGISEAETDKETFLEKTELVQETKCEFVYIEAAANITAGESDTIVSIAIKDDDDFLEKFSAEGNYIFSYDGDYSSFEKSSSTITKVTVNASTYKTYFLDTKDPSYAYTETTFTYDSSIPSWKDINNYAVELSDYGITVTGTPKKNDTITGCLKAKWKNQETSYKDLFIFDGYPMNGDTIVCTVIDNHWIYKKDSAVVIDSGLILSEYGISVVGEPLNGDIIKVNCNGVWELDSTEIDISDYGIKYSGAAILDDEINIVLGTPITIDCELQDAYSSSINRNHDIFVQTTFPELDPGENNISFSGGIISVEVTPRWWTL